jgi:hypothetical protein
MNKDVMTPIRISGAIAEKGVKFQSGYPVLWLRRDR